jgi:hypothetical protein
MSSKFHKLLTSTVSKKQPPSNILFMHSRVLFGINSTSRLTICDIFRDILLHVTFVKVVCFLYNIHSSHMSDMYTPSTGNIWMYPPPLGIFDIVYFNMFSLCANFRPSERRYWHLVCTNKHANKLRKQDNKPEGGDEKIIQEHVLWMMVVMMVMLTAMNAGQMSNVHSLIFFLQRRFAPGLAFRTRGCVFTPRSFCTQVTLTHGNV